MSARFVGISSLVLLGALLIAVNVLTGALLRSTRLDLTQGRLYTLTQGSKNIAQSPAEPVTLTFYYSARAAQGRPQIEAIAGRISDLLDEFARASKGKVTVRTVDPESFSEDEDKAVQAGLMGIPTGTGESIYLGLVGTNTIGGRETIPLFDLGKERFIEYEVARLLQSLAMDKKPVISIISSISIDGGFAMDPQSGRPVQKKGWAFVRELKQLYDVRALTGENIVIPAETTVLLIVHPKNLNTKVQFAIDQYVLKGGKAIVFVDPLCMADDTPMQRGMQTPPDLSSNLENLFNAWGVGFDVKLVAADADMGTRIMAGQPGGKQQQLLFPPYISVDSRGLNKNDPATGKISVINFAMAGALNWKPADASAGPKTGTAAGAEFTAIIETTENSELLEASAMMSLTDPTSILANFKPLGKRLTLAARLTGRLKTAFPQGDPGAAQQADATKEGPATPIVTDALKESAKPAGIVIVADVDVLSDRLWMRDQSFGGISLGATKLADNIDFVTTAIDTFVGAGDLLGVRGRGDYIRPFTRVEEIQRAAEQKSRAEEERLKKKLEETEQKISALQQKNPDGSSAGAIILSDEQKKEIDGFMTERVEARKELRKVQFGLRQDVEKLGAWVKAINIGLVPLAIILIALVWSIVRMVARSASARSAS